MFDRKRLSSLPGLLSTAARELKEHAAVGGFSVRIKEYQMFVTELQRVIGCTIDAPVSKQAIQLCADVLRDILADAAAAAPANPKSEFAKRLARLKKLLDPHLALCVSP